MRLRDLAEVRRRFGYRRLHILLQREGWQVNHKLVYRLHQELGLKLRLKRRGKRPSHLRVALSPAMRPNERWSMDFVSDELIDGRRFRALTVVDNFTREAVLIEPAVSITGKRVAQALETIGRYRGFPGLLP